MLGLLVQLTATKLQKYWVYVHYGSKESLDILEFAVNDSDVFVATRAKDAINRVNRKLYTNAIKSTFPENSTE